MNKHLVASILIMGLSVCAIQAQDNAPRLDKLEYILDRSITMSGALMTSNASQLNSSIEFLSSAGARYAGRTAFVWGGESNLPNVLSLFETQAEAAHQRAPHLVLEACVFEIVTTEVGMLSIPAYVFDAFGLARVNRSFNYSAMLFPDGTGVDQWAKGQSVPDYVQTETKLWVYFAATSYISRGAEAIHFGQVRQMAQQDPTRVHTHAVLQKVRMFAASAARRKFVLCNAHIFEDGWNFNGTLLMNFHAFPSRPRDVVDQPQHAVLAVECDNVICVPYRRSAGGVTVTGEAVDSLPYLVELDNWGKSSTPGQHVANSSWTWGEDEISWFGEQPKAYRQFWMQYAISWLRDQDPRGHFEMAGMRGMVNGQLYFAVDFGDSDAIAKVWASQQRARNTLRAGQTLNLGDGLSSEDGKFALDLQNDGNLVLVNNSATTPAIVWQSGTASRGNKVTMQEDGDLVMESPQGAAVFETGTSGDHGAYLLLMNNGMLSLYFKNSTVVWSARPGLEPVTLFT